MLGRKSFEEMAAEEEPSGEGATVMLDGATSPFADPQEDTIQKDRASPAKAGKAASKAAAPATAEPDEEESPEEGATLMLDSAAVAARLSRAEQGSAESDPEAEDEPEAGATLMLDSAAAAAARARLGDSADDESTAAPSKSKQPVASRAGVYSRRQTGEQKNAKRAEQPAESQEEPVAKIDPAVQRRLTITATVGFVLISLVVFAKVISSGDRPSKDELMLLYPYGIIDTTEPGGRVVPGAVHVRFKYEGTVPCQKDSSVECLEYSYSRDEFSGTMLVKQAPGGWERFDAEPIRGRQ